jgi:hypothetical protein
MLQAVTNNSGQPVVGVNRVGAAIASKKSRDTIAKFIKDLRQVFFREIKWAGIDVHDTKAGFHIDELGLIFSRSPRVDLGLHARLRERADEFAHVHIHPA